MKLVKILSDKVQIRSDYKEFDDVRINDLIAVSDGEVELVTMVNTLTDIDTENEEEIGENDYILEHSSTQSLDGGMTESYLETGTYVKTFYSVMAMPSCIKVSMMYTKHKRIHHRIDWECCVPKIINEKYRKEAR